MADRFYCPSLRPNQRVLLLGDEAKHLARVSRRVQGDLVEVFDGKGYGVEARVESIDRGEIELSIEREIPDRVQVIDVHLFVSPPKGDRLDWLIEKATELGVASVTPIRTARSVVDPRSSKLDRLRRAVIEASKQCGRARLMELGETINFGQMTALAEFETKIIGHMDCASASASLIPPGTSVALAIGPEGGFTDAEIDRAKSAVWLPMSFGATRLRVETAAIVGASCLFHHVRRENG